MGGKGGSTLDSTLGCRRAKIHRFSSQSSIDINWHSTAHCAIPWISCSQQMDLVTLIQTAWPRHAVDEGTVGGC
eukprot:jgi/Mesvir1/23824/Mv25228-RA.1